jgi:uncharacterized repeat protein (TIGR01451 family)
MIPAHIRDDRFASAGTAGRPLGALVATVALVLGLGTAARAQKVGVNCAADGGTNCTAAIPDGGGSLASTVSVPAGACPSVERVCVALGVEHTEMADVGIGLAHLATTVGVSGGTGVDLLRTQVFETEFDGLNGAGTWTLMVSDHVAGEYGAVNNWALGLCCGSDCGDGLVRVDPVSGLTTTEAGGMAAFSVELTCPPFHEVVIPSIASDDASEGVADVSMLSFTAANWTAPQLVTATGQDDPLLDGDIPYGIALGAAVVGSPFSLLQPADLYNPPSVYAGVDPADVALVNLDDETDLAIRKTIVTVGPPVIYEITATNEGLGLVLGALVTDPFPAGLACSWTCTGSGGGMCTAGPASGDIADAINLPPGASVTYTATCAAAAGVVSLRNTATVSPPPGARDLDPADNSASAAPPARIAPAPTLAPWGIAAALAVLALVARRRLSRSTNRPD